MSLTQISGGGAFTNKNIADLNSNFSLLNAGFTPGNVVYCNPASAFTGAQDGSAAKPYTSFAAGYAALRTGMNDVLVLSGNGASSGTARVDASFTWAKDAAHLIGVCSPVLYSQRARIAPSSATTAFTPFFTISGNGCVFQNIQWFMGFTTGTTAQIGMVLTGSRNYFQNCHIAGMADNESAQSATSRSLKIGSAGSGENVFQNCVIGVDTIARTQANASIELTGATARNRFVHCTLPFLAAAGSLGILGTGAACVDRDNTFEDCLFVNQIKSTSTTMTVLGSFTSASPGGMVIFKRCAMVGVTKFGDTNFLANSFLDMPAPSNSAGGLMVPPT